MRRWLKVALVPIISAPLVIGLAAPAWAQAATPSPVEELGIQVNLLWVVLGAVLVIFMQAGFALVETGFTQAKNAGHTVSMNFAVFGLGFIGFFFVGYGLMFGGYTLPLIGFDTPVGTTLIGSGNWTFLFQGGWAGSGDAFKTAGGMAFFLYMAAFMDTVATIPTGSMAERWKWKSFVGWGLFCGAIYYPLFGAWTWGGGWLSKLGNSADLGVGYVDFAGSGVVHAVGGVAALAGAIVLGPRIGKYVNGKPRTIAGHHIPMAMLGTFILLFGWFGFNAASTFAVTDVQFAVVATNTAIAGAFGGIAAMFYCMYTGDKKPDPGMLANGMLAGLVAITAPCAFVEPWGAAAIGIIAGVLVVVAFKFIENRGVDDPVGAIAVHGVCGTFGVIAVGLFASGEYGAGWNGTTTAGDKGVTGFFYDTSFGLDQLVVQLIAVVVIWTVIFGVAFGFFKIQNKLTKGGIRVPEDEEIMGLDKAEMGALAYPDFELKAPEADASDDRSPSPI